MALAFGKSFTDALLQHKLPAQDSHHQGCGKILVNFESASTGFETKQEVAVRLRLPSEFEQQFEGGFAGRGRCGRPI